MTISNTAYQTGFGQAAHKKVQGMTRAEGKLVRSGQRVYFSTGGRLSVGSHGTSWRYAIYYPATGYVPRVPSVEEIAELDRVSA
jgi:hypothetical protein